MSVWPLLTKSPDFFSGRVIIPVVGPELIEPQLLWKRGPLLPVLSPLLLHPSSMGNASTPLPLFFKSTQFVLCFSIPFNPQNLMLYELLLKPPLDYLFFPDSPGIIVSPPPVHARTTGLYHLGRIALVSLVHFSFVFFYNLLINCYGIFMRRGG